MSNDDWRYTDDRLELRGLCLSFLLNRYGGAEIDKATYSTQNIYECVDTWISQGGKSTEGLDYFFKKYFNED